MSHGGQLHQRCCHDTLLTLDRKICPLIHNSTSRSSLFVVTFTSYWLRQVGSPVNTLHAHRVRKEFKTCAGRYYCCSSRHRSTPFRSGTPNLTYLQHHIVDVCSAIRNGHHGSAVGRAQPSAAKPMLHASGREHTGMNE